MVLNLPTSIARDSIPVLNWAHKDLFDFLLVDSDISVVRVYTKVYLVFDHVDIAW
jgi:hypothetical protein